MNNVRLLTILTLAPLLGGIMVIGLGAEQRRLARNLALGFSFLSLALSILLWLNFAATKSELQFEEFHTWIPSLGVQYHLGVDGLSLVLVLLTGIVVPMAMLASWRIQERVPLYFSLVLFLQAGLFGTFTAMNFFHWFIFWELSLIPAYFLIKLWGGPMRSAAAMQFFVYTMVGSVAMLLAFLAIHLCSDEFVPANKRFEFSELADLARRTNLSELFNVKLGWYSLTRNQLGCICERHQANRTKRSVL
jgi:NADH-quinone oxidoreductase subunit M